MIFISCSRENLRGSTQVSLDNKTYLIVTDDNGGYCGNIIVDGKKWNYALHQAGLISAGTHTIECGTSIEFIIPEGVIFSFDYWGP